MQVLLQEMGSGTKVCLQDEQRVFLTAEPVPPEPNTSVDKANSEGEMEDPQEMLHLEL